MAAAKTPEVRFAKTKMCKFHQQGKCAKGAGCSFAHGSTEMEFSPDLYRTQLCMALLKTGKCKDSDICKYAHTREQLRAAPFLREEKSPQPEKATALTAGSASDRGAKKRSSPRDRGADSDEVRQPRSMPSPPLTPPPRPVWVAAVPVLPVGLRTSSMPGFQMAMPPCHMIIGSPSGGNSPVNYNMLPHFALPWAANAPYPYTQDIAVAEKPQVDSKRSSFEAPSESPEVSLKTPLTFELPGGHKWGPLESLDAPVPMPETLSETSTDGTQDSDRFYMDADSLGSSSTSGQQTECFEVSIKNTFLDVSPKSHPQKAPIRLSKSVPR